MVDYFSLALTHALLAIALWRMLQRADLDSEAPPEDENVKDGAVPRLKPRQTALPREKPGA